MSSARIRAKVSRSFFRIRYTTNRFRHAPFTHDAWTDPETLSAISKVAGVDLVPWGNYEIAHINFSEKSKGQVRRELAELESRKRAHAEDEGIGSCPYEDDKPIVGWHKDSYPFVCVLMLSDCTSMIGGETAILGGDGVVRKIRGPSMVSISSYRKTFARSR